MSPGKEPLIEGVDPLAGRLIVAAGDNHADISLVSTRTGAVVNRVSVDQAVDAATVDSQDHIAYVVGNEYINEVGDMNWINTLTGRIMRTINVGNYPDAIAYDRQSHRVFVANSSDDDVMTFSATTGALLHTNNVGKEPSALAVDEHDNRVYALSSSDNTITALDATTGRFISTLSINENAQDLQVLGPKHRLVAIFCPSSACTDDMTDSGSIMVRDGRTGHLIYSGVLGQAPQSMSYDPTLNKIIVFDVGANAALFLDPSSGRTVRRLALGNTVAGIAVLPRINRIVALGLGQVNGDRKPLSDGDLRVYNLQTGHIVGHLDVAESTDGIVGDDVSGNVFLTNSMDNTLKTVNPLAVH